MLRIFRTTFILIILCTDTFHPQSITILGKNVNSAGQGIENSIVELYFSMDYGYGTIRPLKQWVLKTNSFGIFTVSNGVVGISDNVDIPTDYNVSANYPNPFNPKTNINVGVPKECNAEIEVFNILGQLVYRNSKKLLTGNQTLSIDLNGLANGVYISRIIIDGQRSFVNKLLLLYGSQHAVSTVASKPVINYSRVQNSTKTGVVLADTTFYLDSVVVSGALGYKRYSVAINKVVTTNSVLNLGNIISQQTEVINLSGKVYKLWNWNKPNNGIAGARISIGSQSTVTDKDGNYFLRVNKNSKEKVVITQDSIYERRTRMMTHAEGEKMNFDVLDTVNYNSYVINIMFNGDLGKVNNLGNYSRWMETRPVYFFVCDTSTSIGRTRFLQQKTLIQTKLNDLVKTPVYPNGFLSNCLFYVTADTAIWAGGKGYHSILWWDTVPIGEASTGCGFERMTVTNASTEYMKSLSYEYTDEITIHELGTGLGNFWRTSDKNSVFFWNPGQDSKYGTELDKKMFLLKFSRPAMERENIEATSSFINLKIDQDNGEYNDSNWKTPFKLPSPIPKYLNEITVPTTYILKWDYPPELLQYVDDFRLEVYKKNSDGSKKYIFDQKLGKTMSKELVGLDYSTNYYYNISAINSNCQTGLLNGGYWEYWFKTIYDSTLVLGKPCPGVESIVYVGQTYHTIQIGNQCWLKENLNVGQMVQGSIEQTSNGIIEKYCYDDNPSNCATYGGLYQWAEAVNYANGANNVLNQLVNLIGHFRGICPQGWHIPNQFDFEQLLNFAEKNGLEAEAFEEIGQRTGTNVSGFSVLFAGWRYITTAFAHLGISTSFWGTYDKGDCILDFDYWYGSILKLRYEDARGNGHSVRCIKD